MDWADDVPAVLQVWFGGQEMADAIVDVLTGEAEPAGRLPTTFPVRLEHNPSFGNFPGENGEIRYGEGLLVGYRWYDARGLPTRFPFGHGLSYTTFAIGAPAVVDRRADRRRARRPCPSPTRVLVAGPRWCSATSRRAGRGSPGRSRS